MTAKASYIKFQDYLDAFRILITSVGGRITNRSKTIFFWGSFAGIFCLAHFHNNYDGYAVGFFLFFLFILFVGFLGKMYSIFSSFCEFVRTKNPEVFFKEFKNIAPKVSQNYSLIHSLICLLVFLYCIFGVHTSYLQFTSTDANKKVWSVNGEIVDGIRFSNSFSNDVKVFYKNISIPCLEVNAMSADGFNVGVKIRADLFLDPKRLPLVLSSLSSDGREFSKDIEGEIAEVFKKVVEETSISGLNDRNFPVVFYEGLRKNLHPVISRKKFKEDSIAITNLHIRL